VLDYKCESWFFLHAALHAKKISAIRELASQQVLTIQRLTLLVLEFCMREKSGWRQRSAARDG
jgi:hypothetical protein